MGGGGRGRDRDSLPEGGREEAHRGVQVRCFADPTKIVLALCEKRAERVLIEQISSAKDLICKKKEVTR
jgi:hypothetical protein